MANRYLKQPLSSPELLELLKARNLLIPDETRAIRYLDSIGYYRLSGYMFHLQIQDRSHRFIDGTSFNDIVKFYKFDKQLRAIIMEYLERVEVALRAKLTNYYSQEYDFFWYASESLFDDKPLWTSLLTEVREDFEQTKELFLRTYRRNYPTEPLPPSQMALETLSLGKLCRLYKALKSDNNKTQIASDFNLAPITLESWLIWLTNVRNVCAHHGRLWNRTMSADQPKMPSRKAFKFAVPMPEDANTNMYGVVALINRLLRGFNPTNTFAQQIEMLIRENDVDATMMGFPVNWETTAVWHFE